jgi:hypothetical protein
MHKYAVNNTVTGWDVVQGLTHFGKPALVDFASRLLSNGIEHFEASWEKHQGTREGADSVWRADRSMFGLLAVEAILAKLCKAPPILTLN